MKIKHKKVKNNIFRRVMKTQLDSPTLSTHRYNLSRLNTTLITFE